MLRLLAVSKLYNHRPVLRELSLEIKPGTLTVVAGPNGAGKSTLLKIIAGLLPPDGGAVERAAALGEIGWLGHDTLIYPNLTALENLAFWRSLHNLPNDEKTLMAALDRMGLERFADDLSGGFSRGMAQRLSLARMLLLSPRLALLDEPLTGLDAASAKRVREELTELQSRGTAFVWVSHDLANDLHDADAALLLQSNATHALYTGEALSGLAETAQC